MVPNRVPRLAVSQFLRLAVTLPFYAAGLSLMLLSLVVPLVLYWVFIVIFAVALLGILAIAAGGAPDGILPITYLAIATLVLAFGLYRFWLAMRGGFRTEPAAIVARTRPPDSELERNVCGIVNRLCLSVDEPPPAVRIADVDEPLCYTVRYPVETPPREFLERDIRAYRAWSAEQHATDVEYDIDEPIPEDHVLVVSSGLLSTLPRSELTALLAHEIAHLKNRDLVIVQALLLPTYWAGFHLAPDASCGFFEAIAALAMMWITEPGLVVFTRGREFAADAAAARISGDPAALANALNRLDGQDNTPDTDMRAVSVLNVLPPSDPETFVAKLSHPPTEKRVERLGSIAAQQES